MLVYKNEKVIKMTYPSKTDPTQDTWVIAFDVNLRKLYEYARNPQNSSILNGKSPEVFVRDLRATMFDEIYLILRRFGFDKRLQNTLVFNNNKDATIAFKAVSRGLSQSWVKYFIERIHLFRVDPNSDASELLNKDQIIHQENRPDWFDDSVFNYIIQSDICYEEEEMEDF